ncbi:opioid growth factor receptor-like protein 1 [Bombina bombina]|uniref:opioid growth factor receptor-like protein 1 n=1 Tax=Bombina bombina TaxID=8345 RepID=UPI00235AD29F|nr:opioid growth factor receptor-like protein 1 [Bombina bombina]
MGNLLNGVSFKEPTTVEECDSTWDTDSGGEEELEEEEEDDGQVEITESQPGDSCEREKDAEDLGDAAEVTASEKSEDKQISETEQDPDLQLTLKVDASEIGAGAVNPKGPYNFQVAPCSLFSKRFTPAERNYDVAAHAKSVEHCKKRFSDINRILKAKLAREKQSACTTGGGVPYTAELFSYKTQLMEKLRANMTLGLDLVGHDTDEVAASTSAAAVLLRNITAYTTILLPNGLIYRVILQSNMECATGILGKLSYLLADHHATLEATLHMALQPMDVYNPQTRSEPILMDCEGGSALGPQCLLASLNSSDKESERATMLITIEDGEMMNTYTSAAEHKHTSAWIDDNDIAATDQPFQNLDYSRCYTLEYILLTISGLRPFHFMGSRVMWNRDLEFHTELVITDSSTAENNMKPKRSFYAARDLFKYRHQYPQNIKDLRYQNDLCNLRFYMNKIPFKPDGVSIEDILNKWKGDYDKLEHNHTYIQWLFPLREQGLNFYAKELTSSEIEEFKKTKEAVKRFVSAYKMMLDFFGIKLIDKSGNVSRAANWEERFQHLNESQHNYLRITRILKSLGELGYENFKFPLVKILLEESVVKNTIPNMKQSALEYFVYTIRDRRTRRKLLRFANRHYQPAEHFIWGPPKKLNTDESKVGRKTTPANRCHKKHSSIEKKSKETKSSPATERTENQLPIENRTETLPEDVVAKKERCESNACSDSESSDGKCKTDVSKSEASSPHVEDKQHLSLTPENDAGHQSEKLGKSGEIVIVESSDEESKDCLCSLSPVTPNTVDSTASSGETVEPESEPKDGAKC